jgi:hypothetical protein
MGPPIAKDEATALESLEVNKTGHVLIHNFVLHLQRTLPFDAAVRMNLVRHGLVPAWHFQSSASSFTEISP